MVAEYSSELGAPVCSSAGVSCTSGSTLLQKAGDNEPNQSNTLDSCADGTSGTWKIDESIESIAIRNVDGGLLVEGATVEITATTWPWKDGPSLDIVDFYFASDANDPSWQHIGAIVPAAHQEETHSMQYTLPAGSLQAVRVNIRWGGKTSEPPSSACSGGSFDDVDDLVFAVLGAGELPEGEGKPTTKPRPIKPPSPMATLICFDLSDKDRCGAAPGCQWHRGKSRKGGGCRPEKS